VKRPRGLAAAAMAAASLVSGLAGCQVGDEGAVTVTLSLPRTPVAFAKGTVLVDYTRAGAKMLAEGGGPACAFILPGLEGNFADDGRGVLTIRVGSKRGVHGPMDIAACRMKSGDPDATAADLASQISLKIAEALDGAGKPVDLTSKPSKTPGGEGGKGAGEKPAGAGDGEPPSGEAPGSGPAGAGATPPGGVKPAPAPGAAAPTVVKPAAATGATGSATPPPAARPQPPSPSKPTASASTASGNGDGTTGNRSPAASDPNSVPEDSPDVEPDYNKDPNYDDSIGGDSSAPEYDVVVSVSSATQLGALQLEILHLGSAGSWVGKGAGVDCASMVDAILAANFVGGRGVKVGLISLQGIPTPGAVVLCGFRTRERLSPASFQIRLVDAADTDSDPVNPLPDVVISSIVQR
jgi:hypothetical protein